jgi:TetR/AcrR family transcriptional regulator, transcriptional repressor for nem operon
MVLAMDASTQTSATILDTAERLIQTVGYNGLSFRDVAAAVGIKSASVHYHFPTKSHLGVAVARRYTDRLVAHLGDIDARGGDPASAFAAYAGVFRSTVKQEGRMCLGGILAAESDSLPEEMRAEVRRFVDLNVRWISGTLKRALGDRTTSAATKKHALALFSALEGAILIARATGDVANFDAITEQFARVGLLPR